MTDTVTPHIALNESLRADILLLSTYLAGRHEPSHKSQPVNESLPLFVHISTLLTVGNNPSHDGQNANAVVGTATNNAIDFLVCTENRSGHQAHVDQSRTNDAETGPAVEGHRGQRTTSKQMVREAEGCLGQSAREVAYSVRITPTAEAGRKLLAKWDLRTISKEAEISEWVIHPST